MVDSIFKVQVGRTTLRVIEKDAFVDKRVRINLERPFGSDIAAWMGEDGKRAHKLLEGGGAEKVVLPIDAMVCTAHLKGKSTEVKIERVNGIRATAYMPKPKAGAGDDEGESGPAEVMIKFEFYFPFSREAWLFLGENAGAWADLELTKNQLALDLDGKKSDAVKDAIVAAGAKNGKLGTIGEVAEANGKKKRKGKKAKATDDALVAEETTEEQQAAETPEDAERMRKERLAKERAERVEAMDDDPKVLSPEESAEIALAGNPSAAEEDREDGAF